MEARSPQASGGSKLQVAEVFPFSVEDTWFCLNLTFLRLWANLCAFLMEMFFLNYVKETMYLLWILPFFKSVALKTEFFSLLKPWADNGSRNQYSYALFYYGQGWHTLCHSISKMHIVGEGTGETHSAQRCLSYLIGSWLSDIKHLAKN